MRGVKRKNFKDSKRRSTSKYSKGNTIASTASEELEALRAIAFSGKDYLDQMLTREEYLVPSLKIASNNVFGYYIEFETHTRQSEHWVRKQTLVNAERYITEELKEYEQKILGAEDQILAIEQRIFSELISWMHGHIKAVQQNAYLIAQLDCLSAFAHLAKQHHYTSPLLDNSFDFTQKVANSVIEQGIATGRNYVANDVFLDRET